MKNKYKLTDDYAIVFVESKTYGSQQILIDIEDLSKLKGFTWGVFLSSHNKSLYAQTNYKNKNIKLHRLITNCPEDKMIDHINRNTLDNRRCNIRICTNSENQQNKNKYINNISGFIGVNWHKNNKCWQASIRVYKKLLHLGSFKTKEEAIIARQEAEKKYFKPIKSNITEFEKQTNA